MDECPDGRLSEWMIVRMDDCPLACYFPSVVFFGDPIRLWIISELVFVSKYVYICLD